MDYPARHPALAHLDIFVGTWDLEAVFPRDPTVVLRGGRSVFEWLKGGQLLVQRTEVPTLQAPDGILIVAFDPSKESYTQHHFDSRGVIRLYAMGFSNGVWTLLRNAPDFSPLEFSQRFTGTFTDDGDTIRGTWEKSSDGANWEKDFDLTYRRIK
jgi:hypothetical protein